MWDMALASIKLFFAGKLFQNPLAMLRQGLLGAAITAVVTVALAIAGLPIYVAAGLGALVGGVLQPFLFKDLKYR